VVNLIEEVLKKLTKALIQLTDRVNKVENRLKELDSAVDYFKKSFTHTDAFNQVVNRTGRIERDLKRLEDMLANLSGNLRKLDDRVKKLEGVSSVSKMVDQLEVEKKEPIEEHEETMALPDSVLDECIDAAIKRGITDPAKVKEFLKETLLLDVDENRVKERLNVLLKK